MDKVKEPGANAGGGVPSRLGGGAARAPGREERGGRVTESSSPTKELTERNKIRYV